MKTLKFICLVIAAAIVGFFAMCIAIVFNASDGLAIATYFAVAAVVTVALGVFRDSKDAARHTSIKEAARYGQAAIFVGTACLFVGAPNECDELADDLWHRGVQCNVSEINGNEVFDVL